MRASSGRFASVPATATCIDDADAVVVEHEQGVEVVGMLDCEHLVARVHEPHDGRACGRTRHEACGELGGDERSGDERAPELLEDEGSLGHPEAEPSLALGRAQREHARVAELLPALAIEPATGVLDGAHGVGRKTAVAERADALLERDLVVGQLEVHDLQRSRGRPSTRSATMFRCTWEVPAAMLMRSAQKCAWT